METLEGLQVPFAVPGNLHVREKNRQEHFMIVQESRVICRFCRNQEGTQNIQQKCRQLDMLRMLDEKGYHAHSVRITEVSCFLLTHGVSK